MSPLRPEEEAAVSELLAELERPVELVSCSARRKPRCPQRLVAATSA